MIAARAQFLGAGHYAPIADVLVEFASEYVASEGLILEVGAGTAYYLARVVDSLAGRVGLAVDLSKYAARRAANANARIAAIVADVWDRLPVADQSAALMLDVFAPRQPKELHRVLRKDGTLLIATPEAHHLIELRQTLGLLGIDGDKEARITRSFEGYFQPSARKSLVWTMRLTQQSVSALVAMGPSARHLDATMLANRIATLSEPIAVTAAVAIKAYRRI